MTVLADWATEKLCRNPILAAISISKYQYFAYIT